MTWITPGGVAEFSGTTLVMQLLREADDAVLRRYTDWLDTTYKASDIEQMALDTRYCDTVISRLYAKFIDQLLSSVPVYEGRDYVIDGRIVGRWEEPE